VEELKDVIKNTKEQKKKKRKRKNEKECNSFFSGSSKFLAAEFNQ